MKIEKFNKYMKGNFELKDKHIYAYNKLKKINNKLLTKYLIIKQGGSENSSVPASNDNKPAASNNNNKQIISIDFNNKKKKTLASDIEKLLEENKNDFSNEKINDILGFFNNKEIPNYEELQSAFNELMTADKNISIEFNNFKQFLEGNKQFATTDEHQTIITNLLKIQKSMFDLQIKIIFNKLTKIDNACKETSECKDIGSHINSIIDVITKKVDAMNNYMEEQEIKYIKATQNNDNTVHDQKTNLTQQTAVQPSAVQQPAVQPSAVQPSAVQPSAVQQPAVQPSAVQPPAVQQPAVQQPAVQPSAVQPPAVQPSVMQQPAVQPPAVQPSAVQQTAVQQPAVQPSAVQPPAVQPSALQPSVMQQPAVQPPAVQPSAVQQTAVQPSALQKNDVKENTPINVNISSKQSSMEEKPNIPLTDIIFNSSIDIPQPIDIHQNNIHEEIPDYSLLTDDAITQFTKLNNKIIDLPKIYDNIKKNLIKTYDLNGGSKDSLISTDNDSIYSTDKDSTDSTDTIALKMFNNIKFLKNISSKVYNSEVILQLCTIMIDMNYTIEIKKNRGTINFNWNILEHLFFNLSAYNNKYFDFLYNKLINTQCILNNDDITNDTSIYLSICEIAKIKVVKSHKFIFSYKLITKLINILLTQKVDTYNTTPDSIITFNKILIILINKIILLEIYINNSNFVNLINSIYLEILLKINPVLIYVKERCDTQNNKNLRYNVNVKDTEQPGYYDFNINYYNNPFRVGCFTVKMCDDKITALYNTTKGNKINIKNYVTELTEPNEPAKRETVKDIIEKQIIVEENNAYKKIKPDNNTHTTETAKTFNIQFNDYKQRYKVIPRKYYQINKIYRIFSNESEIPKNNDKKKTYYNRYKAKLELGITDNNNSQLIPRLEDINFECAYDNTKHIKEYIKYKFFNKFINYYGTIDLNTYRDKFNGDHWPTGNLNKKKPYEYFTKRENYFLGKINGYYSFNNRNKDDKDLIDDEYGGIKIINKIISKEDIIILGYGQSGSGKTSTLIYSTFDGTTTEGIIPRLLNKLKHSYNDLVILELIFIDIYLNWDNISSLNDITRNHYMIKQMENIEFYFDGSTWKSINNDYNLGKVINDTFDLREIEPTENNPNSSRSHVLIHIKLLDNSRNILSNIVIGDLAGVENTFSGNPSKLVILDKNYSEHSDKYSNKDINEPSKLYFDNFLCKEKYQTNIQTTLLNAIPDKYKDQIITKIRLEYLNNCINFINNTNEIHEKISSSDLFNNIIQPSKVTQPMNPLKGTQRTNPSKGTQPTKSSEDPQLYINFFNNYYRDISKPRTTSTPLNTSLSSPYYCISNEEEFKKQIIENCTSKLTDDFLNLYQITDKDAFNVVINKILSALNMLEKCLLSFNMCMNSPNTDIQLTIQTFLNNTDSLQKSNTQTEESPNVDPDDLYHNLFTHTNNIKLNSTTTISSSTNAIYKNRDSINTCFKWKFEYEKIKNKLIISIIKLIIKETTYNVNNSKENTQYIKDYIMNGIKNSIIKVKSDYIRYHILNFNCTLRKYEGYFINSSLISMKKVISNLILNNVATKSKNANNIMGLNPNIINYLGPAFSNCYLHNFLYSDFDKLNINITQNKIVEDYNSEPKATNKDESEILFRLIFTNNEINTIKGFNLNPANTSIIILTVINLTDSFIIDTDKYSSDYIVDPVNFANIPYGSKESGNPSKKNISKTNIDVKFVNNIPNPPFININKLKLAVNIIRYFRTIYSYFTINNENIEQLNNKLQSIQEKFNRYKKYFMRRITFYSFYNSDEIFKNLILDKNFFIFFDNNNIREGAENEIIKIINYIQVNNETTLIGTCNFFDFTQTININYEFPLCDGTFNVESMKTTNIMYDNNIIPDLVEIDKNINDIFNNDNIINDDDINTND